MFDIMIIDFQRYSIRIKLKNKRDRNNRMEEKY